VEDTAELVPEQETDKIGAQDCWEEQLWRRRGGWCVRESRVLKDEGEERDL